MHTYIHNITHLSTLSPGGSCTVTTAPSAHRTGMPAPEGGPATSPSRVTGRPMNWPRYLPVTKGLTAPKILVASIEGWCLDC